VDRTQRTHIRCLPSSRRGRLRTVLLFARWRWQFKPNVIAPEAPDTDAILHEVSPRDSDASYLALMSGQFPGSWLAFGKAQVGPQRRLLDHHWLVFEKQP
jgi:hypothetical protein